MSTETQVAGHYTRGRLEESILQALKQAGKDPDRLTAADLVAVDEFHVGGIEATQLLAANLELRPRLRLLDIGSGIGGPARYFASEHGCTVTGIDLTPQFVLLAKSLTRRLKLDWLVDFREGNALNMPFEADSFDRAYMLHVGMNIADKEGVFREVRRVLKPGGLFTVFDNVRSGDAPIRYPVPWALDESTSFVVEMKAYREALEATGFRIAREQSHKAFAIDHTQQAMARMQRDGPPVLGLQLLMGEKTPVILANMLAMMKEGVLEPVEVVAQAAP